MPDLPVMDMDMDVTMSPADRITAAKASVALIVCLFTFAAGLLPLKFADRWRSSADREACISRKPTVASLLLCSGGGVLLFTVLVGLQPDVRRSVRVLRAAGRLPDADHLGDLLLCAGFFAVLAIDKAVNSGRTTAVLQPPSSKSFRAMFAVLALAFYETFEGLSAGMRPAGLADSEWCAYAITGAANKPIVAFCLGLELAWSGARKPTIFACAAVFASVTPVGVAVGMALCQCCADAEADQSPGIVPVVVAQALAAGSLAFVVFFEVLPRHKRTGFTHLLATVVGFCVMLLLQIFTRCHQYI